MTPVFIEHLLRSAGAPDRSRKICAGRGTVADFRREASGSRPVECLSAEEEAHLRSEKGPMIHGRQCLTADVVPTWWRHSSDECELPSAGIRTVFVRLRVAAANSFVDGSASAMKPSASYEGFACRCHPDKDRQNPPPHTGHTVYGVAANARQNPRRLPDVLTVGRTGV